MFNKTYPVPERPLSYGEQTEQSRATQRKDRPFRDWQKRQLKPTTYDDQVLKDIEAMETDHSEGMKYDLY